MSYNSILNKEKEKRNYENDKAYAMLPELELYSAVVTTLVADNYYEKTDERLERISSLIKKVSPLFVAQLAIYAREKLNLRSIPLFLIVELAKIHNGDNLVAKTTERVVKRVDEIMELLACYQLRNPKEENYKKLNRLSNQIKNGLKQSFNRFDEYQFAKYNRSNSVIKLKDALFLIHPKAKDETQQELFNKIVNDQLQIPYTWETELSQIGQRKYESEEEKIAAKRECLTRLVESDRLGYMALLRNLRNILEVGVEEEILSKVCEKISSSHAVVNSKQMPFRFYSAFRELQQVVKPETNLVIDALEEAVAYSAMNIQGFDENTSVLLACDVSGSMDYPVSRNSKIMRYDIGILLSSVLKTKCKKVISGVFGNNWLPVVGGPKQILANAEWMQSFANRVGFSTNGYKVIDWLLKNNQRIDKLMFFTDMQMWDSLCGDKHIEKSWKEYKKRFPKAKLYLFDLAGYGQLPIRQLKDDVILLAGWSDKIFDMLNAFEKGESVIDEIKKIEL